MNNNQIVWLAERCEKIDKRSRKKWTLNLHNHRFSTKMLFLLGGFPLTRFCILYIFNVIKKIIFFQDKKLKIKKYCRHTLYRISTQGLPLLALARLQDQKTMFKKRCLYIHFFLIHFILHPTYLFSIWSKLKVSNIGMHELIVCM